ncbi:hypothetical protein DZF79_05310 [Vibrio parahaemolyticus]|nr:hypothetical protein [Vibrio parahaemolyticus]
MAVNTTQTMFDQSKAGDLISNPHISNGYLYVKDFSTALEMRKRTRYNLSKSVAVVLPSSNGKTKTPYSNIIMADIGTTKYTDTESSKEYEIGDAVTWMLGSLRLFVTPIAILFEDGSIVRCYINNELLNPALNAIITAQNSSIGEPDVKSVAQPPEEVIGAVAHYRRNENTNILAVIAGVFVFFFYTLFFFGSNSSPHDIFIPLGFAILSAAAAKILTHYFVFKTIGSVLKEEEKLLAQPYLTKKVSDYEKYEGEINELW